MACRLNDCKMSLLLNTFVLEYCYINSWHCKLKGGKAIKYKVRGEHLITLLLVCCISIHLPLFIKNMSVTFQRKKWNSLSINYFCIEMKWRWNKEKRVKQTYGGSATHPALSSWWCCRRGFWVLLQRSSDTWCRSTLQWNLQRKRKEKKDFLNKNHLDS